MVLHRRQGTMMPLKWGPRLGSRLHDPFGWVGSVLDRKYRIDAVIGAGGFGVVYQAHHLTLDERIAVKFLKLPELLLRGKHARFEADFIQEGRLLHRLSRATAGVVQALDLGVAESPNGAWDTVSRPRMARGPDAAGRDRHAWRTEESTARRGHAPPRARRAGARCRPRPRHRPSRREAREPLSHARRKPRDRQGDRLRDREADGRGGFGPPRRCVGPRLLPAVRRAGAVRSAARQDGPVDRRLRARPCAHRNRVGRAAVRRWRVRGRDASRARPREAALAAARLGSCRAGHGPGARRRSAQSLPPRRRVLGRPRGGIRAWRWWRSGHRPAPNRCSTWRRRSWIRRPR